VFAKQEHYLHNALAGQTQCYPQQNMAKYTHNSGHTTPELVQSRIVVDILRRSPILPLIHALLKNQAYEVSNFVLLMTPKTFQSRYSFDITKMGQNDATRHSNRPLSYIAYNQIPAKEYTDAVSDQNEASKPHCHARHGTNTMLK
jgi:hypothetical protein